MSRCATKATFGVVSTSVRGPKYSAREGKTPAFDERQVRTLIDSIDTGDVIGLRDKTLLMVLAFTAARAGAVARLRVGDYFTDGQVLESTRVMGTGKHARDRTRAQVKAPTPVMSRPTMSVCIDAVPS